ncbi:outer membrane lipoprotein-sorting protein [bacterium]|nr:outer membrane lipoprotein-sorting protein [bacterium]
MKLRILCTTVFALLMITCTTLADEAGQQWLSKIDDAESVPWSIGTMTQTITTTSGDERTFTFESFSADSGDVSLMAYTDPPRVAGDKILMLDGGDQVWYYMKRRDVTRHYAGHTLKQSAMGSDFSYEDLSTGDLQEDYTAELLGEETLEGEPVVKLKATPTPDGPSYDHLILWASTNDHLSRKIEYYDEEGLEKTLILSDFRTVDGRKTAFSMRMDNHRRNSYTVMNTIEIRYNEEPNARLFTKGALAEPIE